MIYQYGEIEMDEDGKLYRKRIPDVLPDRAKLFVPATHGPALRQCRRWFPARLPL